MRGTTLLTKIVNLNEIDTLKLIIDALDALVYVVELDTYEILFANKKCYEEFGDIIGRPCFEALQVGMTTPCGGCVFADDTFKENTSNYKWEHTNSRNKKTYLFSTKMLSLNGRRIKIQVGIDISEQKKLEAEINEQQKKHIETFETFTNATIEALIIYDKNKKCYKVNKVAPEMLGYTASEMIGMDALDFIAEESLEHVRTVIQNRNQEPYEAYMVRKDGSKFPAILRGKDIMLNNKTIRVSAVLDITEIKEKEKLISNLAYYDSLTSLPNRVLLERQVVQLISKTQRTKVYCAMMFIDLDHFKTVNDTKGHIIGDQILVECAARLKSITRGYDIVARFGGDEFIIVIDTQTTDKAKAIDMITAVANKVIKTIKMPFEINKDIFQLSASVGIVDFNDQQDFVELLKLADSAMYHAKDNGRDNFNFFNPDLQSEIQRKALVLERLRDAIHNNKLQVHYQKQVDCCENVIGVEALARWNDDVLGSVSPAEFIPIAEESGLIVRFGEYVLDEAGKLLAEWSTDEEKKKWRVSVNISLNQFDREEFVSLIRSVVEKYKIQANVLRLEITESLLLKNAENALRKIEYLKNFGVTISIDDFGTGYSSLSYLKKLPIDELKIDQSFIKDILTDENDVTIVMAIIAIGKKFGFEVIAEGVETTELYEKLKSMGCDYYQGFLFSRPSPKETL